MSQPQKLSKYVIWGGILSAICYASWPLGFIVNPSTSRTALASSLESIGQPFNWLFISLDSLCALLLIGLAILQWRRIAHYRTLARLGVVGYGLFAVLVVAASATPDHCYIISKICSLQPYSFPQTIHRIASTLSVLLLCVSLVIATGIIYRQRHYRLVAANLMLLSIGWGGLGSALAFALTRNAGAIIVLQNIFITTCSLTIGLVIAGIESANA